MSGREWLECQTCGERLRELAAAEAQRVSANPEAFIAFCGPCGKAELVRLEREARP